MACIEVKTDTMAEKLDEMSDLCEIWKRNRDKGRNPISIRQAMIMLANEIATLSMLKHGEAAENKYFVGHISL